MADYRRVDARGQKTKSWWPPDGKEPIDFQTIQGPLKKSFEYVRAHVERVPLPPNEPRERNLPTIAKGYLLGMQQSEMALLAVVGDKSIDQSLLAGAAIARVMFEGTLNLMAILENPEPAMIAFARDDYWSLRERLTYFARRFPDAEPTDLANLAEYASNLGISPEETAQQKTPKGSWWPKPSVMLKEGESPLSLRGERRAVCKELYDFWYGTLSAISHSRMAALRVAAFTEKHSDALAVTFTQARVTTASLGLVTSLCVLAELEAHFGLALCVPLRAAWENVRKMDRLCESVYQLRYAKLLAMDRM